MIITTFKSKNLLIHGNRYVRKIPGEQKYQWCIQSSNKGYDVEQGTCNAEDLPEDIKKKCDEYNGSFYACKW
jgi:hypothetical protein